MASSIWTQLSLLSLALMAALGLTFGAASPADASWFIKFEGLDGESLDKDHAGWSDLASFGQALHKPGSGSPQSPGHGAMVAEDFSVEKVLDRSSPLLGEASCGGRSFATVTIEACEDPGEHEDPHCYLRYELQNVFVSNYQVNGDAAGGVPLEELSFSYERIRIVYYPADASQPPVEASLGKTCHPEGAEGYIAH